LSDNVKSLLSKYGIIPRKNLGQSFLANDSIAQEIVGAARLSSSDTVLEIGGGLGILTRWIVPFVHKVYVIEKEKALVVALRDLLGESENLDVIEGDALSISLPASNKVVANLPYSIASPITFRLLDEVPFESAVLMYQKEFAERLLSRPGSRHYSRLTIEVTYRADVERVKNVQAREFYPVPKVDSTVVRIVPRSSGPFAHDDAIFHWLIRSIYSYPNKQIRRALRICFRNLGYDDETSDRFIKDCLGGLIGNERLRELGLDDLVRLSDSVFNMVENGMLRDPRSNPK
jgi:16S rRNA (adenine1518-N6/adenine1519-N6)-dimethyltransferase